jgi:UDP-glucose 4-epimerase
MKPVAKQLNVLLTGGAGYIGSHTAVVLTEAGYQVVLYDNLSNSDASVVDRLDKITGTHLALIDGDVRDTSLLAHTLQTHQIDAVIHFAGSKAVGESVAKPIDYFDNNIGGTISLMQAMLTTQVRTLVFSSSATVYGDPQYLPIDEVHPTSATNPYGRSKLHIEEMLVDLAFSHQHSDRNTKPWRIACLRYFNPVGAHDSGLIGEDPNGIPNNLMPYIAHVAAGKLPHLNVFGNDYATLDGTGVRDYIHVMDLAEGHLAALNAISTQSTVINTINLGTGQGYSVLEMIKAFEIASGKQVPYQISARRAGDVATCFADASKAKRELGWKSSRTLEQMCQSTWCFQSRSTEKNG